MATIEETLPKLREPEGPWASIFSYHPFEPVLDRAEGIYLYDKDGRFGVARNRYTQVQPGRRPRALHHVAIWLWPGRFRVYPSAHEFSLTSQCPRSLQSGGSNRAAVGRNCLDL